MATVDGATFVSYFHGRPEKWGGPDQWELKAARAVESGVLPRLLLNVELAANVLDRAVNGGLRTPGKPDRIGVMKRTMRDVRDELRSALAMCETEGE